MKDSRALDTLERFGTALADPIRRQVLLLLLDGPSYPSDLLQQIETSQPNLSNHLACLRGCGLVHGEREGRRVRYELASNALAHALADLTTVELRVVDGHQHLGGEVMAALALGLNGVMFLVVFVARSVVQKRRTGDSGIRAGVLGAAPGSLESVAGWLLVLALAAGLAAPIAQLAGLEPWSTSPVLRGIGLVLAIGGIVLTSVSQLSMGDEWRIGVDPHERTGLVTDGAFGIVRNPIFSCMIVAGAGLALMVPNPISAVGLASLVAAIELQVRWVEEPHLRRLHGEAYLGYTERVGRLVPGIGLTRPAQMADG